MTDEPKFVDVYCLEQYAQQIAEALDMDHMPIVDKDETYGLSCPDGRFATCWVKGIDANVRVFITTIPEDTRDYEW